MKIVIFGALVLFSTTEIHADLSNQPIKIQKLVERFFNLNPDTKIVQSLGKSLKLTTDEEQVDLESREFPDVSYDFKNVTVSRLNSDAQIPKIHYTLLTCDFRERLKICQSINPPDVEIRGIYELGKTPEPHKLAENFFIKQYDGKLIYQMFSNGTTDTDLVYKDQEMKFGETSKYHITIVRAIGAIVDDVNNRTAIQLNQNTNIPKKIKDFEHIFPFLSDSLSPINKTALRSEEENVYSINNTEMEHWENMYWILPYVVIRGLNNFKQAKIMVYDDKEWVRFNMTLTTDKLKGYFEWRFGKDENVTNFKPMQNFTIDNLTLIANTRLKKDWVVDKIDVDLGSMALSKAKASESYPDINEFVYQILLDNLEMVIKTHLEKLLHAEFAQSAKSSQLNSTPTQPLGTNQTTTEGRLIIDLLNHTTNASTLSPNDTTSCIDDRRWWQKVYRRNKCKESKKPVPPKIPETDKCQDTRWWFQKPFLRSKCAKNMSSKSTPTTQQPPEARNDSDLQPNGNKKCVDKRWWFQKAFIRNECKPEGSVKSNT